MADRKYGDSVDDAAYQALEEALKMEVSEPSSHPSARQASSASEGKVPDTSKQRSAEQPRSRGKEGEAARAAAENTARNPALEAANDASRRTPAAILRSLETGSMRSALRNATLVSVLWAIGGVGLAQMLFGSEIWRAASLTEALAQPGLIAIFVGIVVPVLIFYAFSIMMARAHDLRNAARSMAEVALRLAEPETIASERIIDRKSVV